MGIGGNFWENLKPYCKKEGFNFIRNKKVAIDLSYWIVQHESALKSTRVRNPHLRLTFFRTLNLFSKFGAYPVFVVDGKSSPLKSQARIARFFRSSGIDPKYIPVAEEGVSVDRNKFFVKCVEECVDLLKHLGMPVIVAKGEAEALCAQLNNEGFVDACITADSDAFLFGAKCVIKHVDPNSVAPFECYFADYIEVGLGLQRKHLIAVSLLVGNDLNLGGVQGIGVETAFRFVQKYHEDEVLERLKELASGSDASVNSPSKCPSSSNKLLQKIKTPHCSVCGHPGNKTIHSRVPCEYCHSLTGVNCSRKPLGFKCGCSCCDRDRKERDDKKNDNWHLRVCKKIANGCGFSYNEIIEIYLRNEDTIDFGACLSWKGPDIEMLIGFLEYHLLWEPSYIRRQLFPMLSTIFLRDIAVNRSENLMLGQFKFDSIQRVKIRYGHKFYVVRWKKLYPSMGDDNFSVSSESYLIETASEGEEIQMNDSNNVDELNVSELHVDGGKSFILTDEDLELVQNSFPAAVEIFVKQKDEKESKRKKSRVLGNCLESHSLDSGSVQLTITDYYRSNKPTNEVKDNHGLSQRQETDCSRGKSKVSSATLPKSVRRRLLFG